MHTPCKRCGRGVRRDYLRRVSYRGHTSYRGHSRSLRKRGRRQASFPLAPCREGRRCTVRCCRRARTGKRRISCGPRAAAGPKRRRRTAGRHVSTEYGRRPCRPPLVHRAVCRRRSPRNYRRSLPRGACRPRTSHSRSGVAVVSPRDTSRRYRCYRTCRPGSSCTVASCQNSCRPSFRQGKPPAARTAELSG